MKIPIILFISLFAVVLVFGCTGDKEESSELSEDLTQEIDQNLPAPKDESEITEEVTQELPQTIEQIQVENIDEPELTQDDDFDLGEII